MGQEPVVKTFGIYWNSTEVQLPVTKRNVLRKAATVFDLLGSVGTFVSKAKILLQELWRRGYDWDDIIHDEIASRMGRWYGQFRSLGNVQVPRCLREGGSR